MSGWAEKKQNTFKKDLKKVKAIQFKPLFFEVQQHFIALNHKHSLLPYEEQQMRVLWSLSWHYNAEKKKKNALGCHTNPL